MCRWLAYRGAPVHLDALLFKPENSLIAQSLHARKSHVVTNGDGFGLGWYAHRPEPGLYREVRPAWNDENLRSLAEQIQAHLFFAHVRASTGTATARANCHPFRHDNWLFMHNGQVGGYERIRRSLDFRVSPDLYTSRLGTTDSETFFLLALGDGLDADPIGAIARTTGHVFAAMQSAGIAEPLRLTAALTDGERIYAVRWSSDAQSPSLFYGAGAGVRGTDDEVDDDSILVLSEPLDSDSEHWSAVGEGMALAVEGSKVRVAPFSPQMPRGQ